METMFCRLKRYDHRRGHLLRRFTYKGIKFHEERGWYRVEKTIADYLRTVHQADSNEHSPLAFDVCTEEEAKALDTKEKEEGTVRKEASDNIKLSVPRNSGDLTTQDLPDASGGLKSTTKAKKN